jgi:hypothetical protein
MSVLGRRRTSEDPSASAVRAAASSEIIALLIGELPLAAWPGEGGPANEPGGVWDEFVQARDALGRGDVVEACAGWRRIADREDIGSRHTLQAWYFLRQHGIEPPDAIATDVYGAMIEVPVPDGHDTLSVYRDGAVRYLNASGTMRVVEAGAPVSRFDEPIDGLLSAAEDLARYAGTWDEPDLPPVFAGHLRATALTPAGIRFGQGQYDTAANEPLMVAMLTAGAVVLQEMSRVAPPDPA